MIPRKSMSFFTRLMLSFVALGIIPLGIFAILTSQTLNSMAIRQAKDLSDNQLSSLENFMDEFLSTSSDRLQLVTQDQELKRAIIDRKEETEGLYVQLYRLVNDLYPAAGISLYDAGGRVVYTTDPMNADIQMPLSWGPLQRAGSADDVIIYWDTTKNSRYALQLAAPLYHNRLKIGYVSLGISEENLRRSLATQIHANYRMLLLDPFGHLVLGEPSHSTEISADLRQAVSGHASLDQQDLDQQSRYTYYFSYSPTYRYYFILIASMPFPMELQNLLRLTTIFTIGLSIVLSALLAVLLSRHLSRPIRSLSQGMRRVREGNLDLKLEAERNDELGELTLSFNEMLGRINELMRESLQQQQEIDEARILLLQSQLTPHFLYNTLDTIKWLSKMGENQTAATVTEKLVILLRRCVSNERLISLDEETQTIESYLEIQRIRFAGDFEHGTYFPDDLEACLVPNMILLPLVENSVLHGLRNIRNGYIYIQARREQDDTLVLSVTDNGQGMSEEQVQRLNNPDEHKHNTGKVGLRNIRQILQRIWNDKASFEIRSIPEIGTEVTITMPLIWREDDV